MEEVLRMQETLLLIRRAVGWSAEELGNQIGVTRQTINNIESGRSKLTKTQYIAMRSVLDAEIAKCPDETESLRLILDMFVDHPENYKEEDKKDFLDKANMITPSILAGTATRAAASQELMKTAGLIAGGVVATTFARLTAPIFGGVVSAWLVKALSSDKNKKE